MKDDERERAFAALRAHPELASFLERRSSDAGGGTGCRDGALMVAAIAGSLALCVLCALFLPQLVFVPLVGGLAGVVSLVGWLLKRPDDGPVRRFAVRVLEVRAHVTSRGGADGERLYRVVVEDEDGEREELSATGDPGDELVPGALGVAAARGTLLEGWVELVRAPREPGR